MTPTWASEQTRRPSGSRRSRCVPRGGHQAAFLARGQAQHRSRITLPVSSGSATATRRSERPPPSRRPRYRAAGMWSPTAQRGILLKVRKRVASMDGRPPEPDLEPLPVEGDAVRPDRRVPPRVPWRAAVAALAVTAAGLGGHQLGRASAEESLERQVDDVRRRLEALEAVVGDDRVSSLSISVPSVVGLELRDAQELLRRAGFRPALLAGDPSAGETRVVAQEPGGGLIVRTGAIIGLRTAPRQYPG